MPTVLDFQRLRETLLPEWTKPENASVFDPAYRAPIRTIIKWLGLDDPQQVMAFGTPLEAGPMAGGAIEALGKRFPRFAEALKTYTHPGQPPFYSRLEESVRGMGKQVPAPKLLGVVQKGQASAEELSARGVPEFAAQYGTKPIPKEAIAAHLEANPVQLQVKTLGGPPAVETQNYDNFVREMQAKYGQDYQSSLTEAERYHRRDLRDAMFHTEKGPDPKYAQYQLPGGTNYRETLITLPENAPKSFDQFLIDEGYTAEQIADPESMRKARDGYENVVRHGGARPNTFRSSHFDEPNILVHTRSNERDLPGLGRGTFLEEVQSDWHQQGKARGYVKGPEKLVLYDVRDTSGFKHGSFDSRESAQRYIDGQTGEFKRSLRIEQGETLSVTRGVPDAPFKETWPDLALKHHLVEAAQNPETNWLGFTSGETQAARYDLSKQVESIDYRRSGNGYELGVVGLHGEGIDLPKSVYRAEELPSVVGKEIADKIVSGEGQSGGGRMTLRGVDLKVGGEGMKYFYDTLLPKRLEKIVKPFGGTVERVDVPFVKGGKANDPAYVRAIRAERKPDASAPAWIIKLTPEMKRRILTEGVPLMTGVAAVGSAQREK